MKNSLPEVIADKELILRAVRPWPRYWKNNGQLSSAALIDERGLSVERQYDRSLDEAIEFLLQHLSGHVIALTNAACQSVNALIKYDPSWNIYHCLLLGGQDRIALDEEQAKELALSAEVVYRASISTT